jgi:uncharacterized protein (TIGR00369 family)
MVELTAEVNKVLAEGTAEEKEMLRLAMQAIKQKRERKSAYLSGMLGLSGEFIDDHTYQFRVPITPFMINRSGVVHGGITASLADSTMGSLINKRLPEGYYAVTSEMKVNYLRVGIGTELIAQAKLIHKGQTLVVAQCEITNERGHKIAFASATFYVIRIAENAPALK